MGCFGRVRLLERRFVFSNAEVATRSLDGRRGHGTRRLA